MKVRRKSCPRMLPSSRRGCKVCDKFLHMTSASSGSVFSRMLCERGFSLAPLRRTVYTTVSQRKVGSNVNRIAYARLFHVLYRVALALVLAMLVLVHVQSIGLPLFLCFFSISMSLLAEYKALFSELHLTTFKLE